MGKILLVEPDIGLIPVLGEILTISGNTYTPARSRIEALSFLQKKMFDLVIIDVSLQLIAGNRFIEEVSKLPDPPPVIVLTDNSDKVKPNQVVKEIIAKPLETKTLKEALQKHISPSKD